MEDKFKLRSATRRALWRWASTTKTIERLERERDYFRKMADDARCMLKAQQLTGMPGGGKLPDLSDVIAQVERSANMYVQQSERINSEIAAAMELRNEIQSCIIKLDPIQQKIIAYRYQDGYTWRFIGIKINYDEKSARRIEARAVDQIAADLKNLPQ